MHLSPVGAIADVLWHELTNHFDNIELDAFVVMPYHIHGIIAINNVVNGINGGNEGNGDNGGKRTSKRRNKTLPARKYWNGSPKE